MKPTVAIVLLAAGMSKRMRTSGNHKLLAQFDGMPLVRRSALTAVGSHASRVVVVVGHRQTDIRAALLNIPLTIVENPDYQSGMASSLSSGVASPDVSAADGVLVLLADMPYVTSADLNKLIAAFSSAGGQAIVRATSEGRRGNPVILPQKLFEGIHQLRGDVGARDLILNSGLSVTDVEIGQAALVDVDTPEAIRAAGGVLECDLIHPTNKRTPPAS